MTLSEFMEKPAVQISIASVLPYLGGLAVAPWRQAAIPEWYEKGLMKPNWTPPTYSWAPIWGVMSGTTGYASYLVWKEGGGFSGDAQVALSLYAGQLALNWAWSPIFFKFKQIKWSLIEISALLGLAGATGVAFYQVNKTAGFLFIPYVAWLGFATALNYKIYKLNMKIEPVITPGKTASKKNLI